MLTVTIFATIVADMLPVSNNTPLIGQKLDILTSFLPFLTHPYAPLKQTLVPRYLTLI